MTNTCSNKVASEPSGALTVKAMTHELIKLTVQQLVEIPRQFGSDGYRHGSVVVSSISWLWHLSHTHSSEKLLSGLWPSLEALSIAGQCAS